MNGIHNTQRYLHRVISILNLSSYHAPSHSVICKCVVTPRQKKIMCGMCRKFTHTAISRKCMKSPAQLPDYDKYTCKECKDKVTRVYIYIYIYIYQYWYSGTHSKCNYLQSMLEFNIQ